MATLQLTARDIARLQQAQQVLLSPQDEQSSSDWQLRVNRAVREYVGADHAVFFQPNGPDFSSALITSNDTDPLFPDRLRACVVGFAEGAFRAGDPLLEQAHRSRVEGGTGAYGLEMFAGMDAWKRAPSYREVFEPSGLRYMVGLSTPGPAGETTQFLGYDDVSAEGRGEEIVKRLALLAVPFEAGIRMRRQPAVRHTKLASALDQLGQSLAVYSSTGVRLHVNRSLSDLLTREPQAERICTEMDALAKGLVAQRWTSPRKSSARPLTAKAQRCVRTANAEYRLMGCYLAPQTFGMNGVLVLLERTRPLIPTAEYVREHFGLTNREAEIALLLAEGLSDAAVAERLFISRHTARRHSERILKKLNIQSRAAVAITLLRGPAEP